MALVKLGSSSGKKPCNKSTKDDVILTNGTRSAPNEFNRVNAFSQFFYKRVIVQDSNGGGSPITRIEEAAFACKPNQPTYNSSQFRGQSYDKVLQPDGVKERHHQKKSSQSKNGSLPKCSKKIGSSRSKHGKETKALYSTVAPAFMLVCLLFGWWFSKQYWCQRQSLDFSGLESSLKNTVIGQEDTLNSLLLNFYRSNLDNQPPVFIISGSTGVGKSFVVDLLVENFPGAGYKELLFYPAPAPETVVTRLVTCEHNLLILDGLYFKDSHEIASWTQRIQKEASAYSKPLWIILVFTTEHWTSETADTPKADFVREISKISNKIQGVFTSQEIEAKLITFNPMDVGNVKECARRELENLNLLAHESQLDQIVQQLTSTPTLRQKGCKHVKKYFLHASNISGFPKADE